MRLEGLLYFYRRRLRIHAVQELLAGVGVTVAVALVFSVIVANGSITSSASAVARAVTGSAQLQLHARGPDGFDERLLARVEHLAGVKQAAPLLEETGMLQAPDGTQASVTIAGTDLSLAILDGLAHTLPVAALSPGAIGLSKTTASSLGLNSSGPPIRLMLRGRATSLKVSAVLGHEAAGALSQAQVAVMPLTQLQELAGLPGRVSRIIVQAEPGRVEMVERELKQLASGRLSVAPADQDVALLHQALGPSNQASDLFAGLAGLLGFLFAFNAILLTVPERRQAIAELRMEGAKRSAIVQMAIFQALCLGILASLVGLLAGYGLSQGLFHQSPGYLTKAFTLGTSTVVGITPIVVSLCGGILASCLASLVPLWDLRHIRRLDRVGADTNSGSVAIAARYRLIAALAAGLVLVATGLFVFVPTAAIFACVLLALATVVAVPVILGVALRAADAISLRNPKLTVLPLVVDMLKDTTLRSLALAATGAVALFGSVALGASRDDLLRGIDGYTAHYAGSADVWLVNPADHQATSDFPASNIQSQVAKVPGVASIAAYQGSYLDYASRRVWVIAWPPDSGFGLLTGQIIEGTQTAAISQMQEGGAITVSDQIAAEHHVKVGGLLSLPTPSGTVRYRVAATTTNFGWSPGAILMSTGDYQHAWQSSDPSALGVKVAPGADAAKVRQAIMRELGSSSGLEVLTAKSRETAIDSSASEGLSQLGEISWLLVAAAILAMIAALGSSIWQRRTALAELRLEGASVRQRRLLLLTESGIMLGAGCLTGTVAGIYGQVVIDGYLRHVTGFPVAGAATGATPVEIFLTVIATVLLITGVPGWFASRAPATLALNSNG